MRLSAETLPPFLPVATPVIFTAEILVLQQAVSIVVVHPGNVCEGYTRYSLSKDMVATAQRERDRQTETETETERDRERQRETERQRDRENSNSNSKTVLCRIVV